MAMIRGTSSNDYLSGTQAADSIYGGDGDDTLIGGAGNDYFSDSSGNNVVFGDAGNDYIWYTGNVTFGGEGNDYIRGAGTAYGEAGADTLYGGADSILYGGGGKDVLSLSWVPQQSVDGGSGTDRFAVQRWDLDLTAIANDKIRNIEIIDLETYTPYNTELRQTLTLKKADLLDISSTTNTLKVLGRDADTVDIVGNFRDLGVSGDFHHYKLGAGMLLVDTDITDVH
jgi:Ca2+-binding RTX toxin-like protein